MVEVKFTLKQAMKTQKGSRSIDYSFFDLGARWGGESRAPTALSPGKRSGTGGWEGSGTDLDGCGEFRPPSGLDPRNVHPAASH